MESKKIVIIFLYLFGFSISQVVAQLPQVSIGGNTTTIVQSPIGIPKVEIKTPTQISNGSSNITNYWTTDSDQTGLNGSKTMNGNLTINQNYRFRFQGQFGQVNINDVPTVNSFAGDSSPMISGGTNAGITIQDYFLVSDVNHLFGGNSTAFAFISNDNSISTNQVFLANFDTNTMTITGQNKLVVDSNITANNICYSNGTNCQPSGNSSWNQSYANTLYCFANGTNSTGQQCDLNMDTTNYTNTALTNLTNNVYQGNQTYNGSNLNITNNLTAETNVKSVARFGFNNTDNNTGLYKYVFFNDATTDATRTILMSVKSGNTASLASTLILKNYLATAQMSDGFGTGILAILQDNDSVENFAGRLAFTRNGADNTSNMRLSNWNNGVENIFMTADNSTVNFNQSINFSSDLYSSNNNFTYNYSTHSLGINVKPTWLIHVNANSTDVNMLNITGDRYTGTNTNAIFTTTTRTYSPTLPTDQEAGFTGVNYNFVNNASLTQNTSRFHRSTSGTVFNLAMTSNGVFNDTNSFGTTDVSDTLFSGTLTGSQNFNSSRGNSWTGTIFKANVGGGPLSSRAGNTTTLNLVGFDITASPSLPALQVGNYNTNVYGLKFSGSGQNYVNTTNVYMMYGQLDPSNIPLGNYNRYGMYIVKGTRSGVNNSYGVYFENESNYFGGDNSKINTFGGIINATNDFIGTVNKKIYLDQAKASSIYNNNSDIIINSKETGSGQLYILGNTNINNNLSINDSLNVSKNTLVNNLTVMGNFSAKRPYLVATDNSTQNFLNVANAQVMTFHWVEDNWLVNVENKENITFLQSGDYQFTIMPEFFQNSGNNKQVQFWQQEWNGSTWSDVPRSNSRIDLSNGNYVPLSITLQNDINTSQGTKIRFMWWSDSTNTQLVDIPNASSPTRPEVPSIILNVQKVSELAGTGVPVYTP